MLTSIRVADSTKVIARNVTKGDGPFICPECRGETIVRKGQFKVHHFAHKPPIHCEYGTGESEEHRRCKEEIYNELCKLDGIECELEKPLGLVRPDIYIESRRTNNRYAIEVQLSSLSVDKIIERTKEYARLGVYVLWLPQYNSTLLEEKYSPRAWEKWLHATYYGRVYYWKSGLTVVPVHFDEYQLYVELTDFGGGYFKKSKRWRTTRFGPSLDFSTSFKPEKRSAWDGGEISVPYCMILVDKQNPWW